jgi:hypothetical protein
MTLKPAHLSYKCTVCTATFGMYKLFENHVYSAHSTVAKKDNKNKSSTSTSGSSSGNNSLLKPLKINDEITIIPQPTKRMSDMESHIIGECPVTSAKAFKVSISVLNFCSQIESSLTHYQSALEAAISTYLGAKIPTR